MKMDCDNYIDGRKVILLKAAIFYTFTRRVSFEQGPNNKYCSYSLFIFTNSGLRSLFVFNPVKSSY